MKKALLFFAGALIAATVVNAQITLSSFTYTPPSNDSFDVTGHLTAYPSFAAATNASWDMSNVTDSTNAVVYRVASSALSSTFGDSSGYTFGGFGYQGNLLSDITASGIIQYGFSTPGGGYSLSALTSVPGDTLVIANQVDGYTSAATILKFPATMSTSWSSSYNDSIDFNITVTLLSYAYAPGYIKSEVSRHDTVIGWGQMKVKTASGGVSGYMNVLQVRTQIATTNYYYVNGSLLSGAALTALNLTQGQTTTTYEQNFYRAGEISPLVNVQFSDSANTTPTSVTTHEQRLASSEGVANVSAANGIKVYPNPVTGHNISIDITAATGNWKYELVNVTGQTVVAGALQLSGNQAQVSVPASVTPGIYYICLINNGRQVTVKPLEIK